MDPSELVIIATMIFALVGFGFVIIAFLMSENNLKAINEAKTETSTVNNIGVESIISDQEIVDDTFCTGKGIPQSAPAPIFTRHTIKSGAVQALSKTTPIFQIVEHTVQKLHRTRSIKDIISPNHWMGNTMYENNNFFSVYPYFGTIQDDSFSFSWPGSSTIMKNYNNVGQEGNLHYEVSSGLQITIGSGKSLSCDILDVDALITTVAWQYKNNKDIGSITIPLAKGSPFITAEIRNVTTELNCNFSFVLESFKSNMAYTIKANSADKSGYILFLPSSLILTNQVDKIIIPSISGTVRIAYFDSIDTLNILSRYHNIYPVESTITTKSNKVDSMGILNVYTDYIWTTKNMISSTEPYDKLLMIALPHHNVSNIEFNSHDIHHPVLGPYQLITTSNNMWKLCDNVADYKFDYPIPSNGKDALTLVWETEIDNVSKLNPQDTVSWMKWLGSLALLILIGNMLKRDISKYQNILEDQLSLIHNNKGIISGINTLAYDKTWGGIVNNIGLTDCSGGDSFYEINFGYIIFAYAVAGYFNQAFIDNNRETALYFARDMANPYEHDNSFPLWRHKDWYFGYSLSSGLNPNQSKGKDSSKIAETIAGYYGVYLLSQVLGEVELADWSLALLASEITASQHYFQLSACNAITADPMFVQNTVTNRGDSYYSYGADDKIYPEIHGSNLISMMKPLNLMSFDHISNDWVTKMHPCVSGSITDNIQAESLAYALAILSVDNTSAKADSLKIIINNKDIVLPYGSTWSSILYWILNQ